LIQDSDESIVGRRMSRSPGSLESLRRRNRMRVVQVLEQRGQASRAEIARETGLSPTAVTSLVVDLLAEGIVAATDAAQPGAVFWRVRRDRVRP
jgi:predicted ArsR family transcriptional regulator